MHYAYTIVYVHDPEASLSFFERAFGLERRFISPEGDYGELQTGSTTLSFARHALARESLGQDYAPVDASALPPGIEIGFAVADVSAAVARAVEAGATVLKDPTVKPWGQTVAYVRCPDGSLVELCTPMGG
ncbi:VOC family protein [Sphaerotilus mobilis]|uniref:Putative enzyme related to lactoylglutathione lyase n=1 Tax=Sphaerotilus mobilis TaxID=47994 RepID=A0A4Q7M5R7_9BURK|nr:VOC family protein [Sphaerotilus mobilis]RZS63316.1 putative enzyme related to lactoylglutathione lyase [Sphaerotilus mobilis]